MSLTPADLDLAKENASKCSLGGRSAVRFRSQRDETCDTDQLTGQVCELAFSKYWFGSVEPYRQARWIRNQNPRLGDNGFDFPGLAINIKGSLRRNLAKAFETYHLLIRPAERTPGMIYVQAVADLSQSPLVVFLGFLEDHEVPPAVSDHWNFKGAHAVSFEQLHRLPSNPWRL